jgi:hypothetical protein
MSDATEPSPPMNLRAQILDLVSEATKHADQAAEFCEAGSFTLTARQLILMGRRLGDAMVLLAERELP